ncbi:hypothetical protein VIGAN_11185500 [Vigna angularis var. angularis]|uniref:Uncharacterized protein n=1 Tax=Vigna angularis var. angularis TaxID=157739 RepID=A0A0S3TAW4_PHAAN|nr:hypothetical protein VIGAN_11185500 [Vigna angularis var. angularis]
MTPEDSIECAVKGFIPGNSVRKDSARVTESGILGYRPLVVFVAVLMQLTITSFVNSGEYEKNICKSIPRLVAAA